MPYPYPSHLLPPPLPQPETTCRPAKRRRADQTNPMPAVAAREEHMDRARSIHSFMLMRRPAAAAAAACMYLTPAARSHDTSTLGDHHSSRAAGRFFFSFKVQTYTQAGQQQQHQHPTRFHAECAMRNQLLPCVTAPLPRLAPSRPPTWHAHTTPHTHTRKL
jgi:hypothetical protein